MNVRHVCPYAEVEWVGDNWCWYCEKRHGIATHLPLFHRSERSIEAAETQRWAGVVGRGSV